MVTGARWVWGLTAIFAGCAVGAEPEPTTFGGPGPGGNVTDTGVDTDRSESTTTGQPPEPEPPTDEGDTTAADEDDTTTTGEDASEGSSGGGSQGACVATNTCPTASGLGGVSGDENSAGLDANGQLPTWVEFEVSEDDSSVFGSGMSFTVTLSSPPGADFDLFVYRSAEGGSSGCGGQMQQSTNAGGFDSVSMSWGEGGVANNSDDGVWVAVEIRAKNDICAPPGEWTLVVSGNT